MTNSSEKQFTEELAKVYREQEDLTEQAKAIIAAAKDAGHDPKHVRKVAKELNMDSSKLADRYDAEQQLDMFRDRVGIRRLKGLSAGFAEAAE